MIQLVLVGCAGRMGRVIADCVRQREDCVISAGVDTAAKGDETFPVYSACCDIAEPADAVIDFSHPSALEGTLAFARERKIPVVMATTGLGDEHKALLEQASQTIPVFTSANMSVGVNLIRELCAKAAQILEDGYDIEIVEAHHNQKLDAPSGTALMLADAVKSLPARGKYLVFFSEKGPDALSDRFGAGFAAALGDVCAAAPLAPESRTALAAQQLNALAQRCKARLGLTLAVDPAVRDEAAACYSRQNGSKPILAYVERIFRSLTQYTLEYDPAPGTRLEVKPGEGGLVLAPESGEAIPLARLLPAGGSALAQVEAELNEIVGLAPIKDYVLSLKDNVLVQQRRKEQGLKSAAVSMHMIFAGNPGTGKTTIARLVSKYLKAIGALGGGQLVEVSRADLVGRYVGHTAPLVNQVISTALGGVLFIDEAYSLYRGEQDSFGLEAIDTLVKGMEDHRDELVVVLAGYTKEMQEFLTANSGLASRFPNFIEFPDYTADELLRITRLQAKGKGYRMEDACDAPLLAYYARRQAEDAATAGNGRLARNKLEQAILNQSRRLVAEPNAPLDLLLWTDFELEE